MATVTVDDLVAAELAHLDRIAEDLTVSDDEAVYAHLRAHGLRWLGAEAAAHILRQEAHDALAGRVRPPIAQAEPVWWLGVTARRAGFNAWDATGGKGNGLRRGFEIRQLAQALKRRRLAAKTKTRKAAGR
jgi:hypothetical protein